APACSGARPGCSELPVAGFGAACSLARGVAGSEGLVAAAPGACSFGRLAAGAGVPWPLAASAGRAAGSPALCSRAGIFGSLLLASGLANWGLAASVLPISVLPISVLLVSALPDCPEGFVVSEAAAGLFFSVGLVPRSEEHTSELQSPYD